MLPCADSGGIVNLEFVLVGGTREFCGTALSNSLREIEAFQQILESLTVTEIVVPGNWFAIIPEALPVVRGPSNVDRCARVPTKAPIEGLP